MQHLLPRVDAFLEEDGIIVWRLPVDLSQSRLGGRIKPSNACTLIAIQLAEIIHRNNIKMPYPNINLTSSVIILSSQRASAGTERIKNKEIEEKKETVDEETQTIPCPYEILCCIIDAILDGNNIHENAVQNRPNNEQNFTIPDALTACNATFMEVDFASVPGSILTKLPRYLKTVISCSVLRHDPRIFIVMIAFERTVLLIYERSTHTFTLVDSHMHSPTEGAVVATFQSCFISSFTNWMIINIFPESVTSTHQEFEISVIRFCGSSLPSDCIIESYDSSFYKTSIFPPYRSNLKRPSQPLINQLPIKKMPSTEIISINNQLEIIVDL